MANNHTLSRSGETEALDGLGGVVNEQTGNGAIEARQYLVGFDALETLDGIVPESGRIVRTAALETLGRAAVVELPESAVPELVSADGIEYVLDLDHL